MKPAGLLKLKNVQAGTVFTFKESEDFYMKYSFGTNRFYSPRTGQLLEKQKNCIVKIYDQKREISNFRFFKEMLKLRNTLKGIKVTSDYRVLIY